VSWNPLENGDRTHKFVWSLSQCQQQKVPILRKLPYAEVPLSLECGSKKLSRRAAQRIASLRRSHPSLQLSSNNRSPQPRRTSTHTHHCELVTKLSRHPTLLRSTTIAKHNGPHDETGLVRVPMIRGHLPRTHPPFTNNPHRQLQSVHSRAFRVHGPHGPVHALIHRAFPMPALTFSAPAIVPTEDALPHAHRIGFPLNSLLHGVYLTSGGWDHDHWAGQILAAHRSSTTRRNSARCL
jgi:hypothetical protein